MSIQIKHAHYCTEIGQRENNEDSIFPRPGELNEQSRLFIVCDGVGGFEQGEVASESVSASFAQYWDEHREEDDTEIKINHALHFALSQLSAIAPQAQKKSMSTTLTLASVAESAILIAHVGDSRIYHIRPKEGILFKTKDHTYIQSWIDAGILTEEEAKTHPKKNIILRAIAPNPEEHIVADVALLTDIQDGDYLFMCTDGILESLSDKGLLHILTQESDDAQKMNQISQLCRANSRDNYSAYLIHLGLNENNNESLVKKDVVEVENEDEVEEEDVEDDTQEPESSQCSLNKMDIEIRHRERERRKIKLPLHLEDEAGFNDFCHQDAHLKKNNSTLKLSILIIIFFTLLGSTILILRNHMQDEPRLTTAPFLISSNKEQPHTAHREECSSTEQDDEDPTPEAQAHSTEQEEQEEQDNNDASSKKVEQHLEKETTQPETLWKWSIFYPIK